MYPKTKQLVAIVSTCALIGIAHAETSLNWVDATDLPGVKVAILAGNPSKKEFFVARIQIPAGYTLPVHSHSINEYDTVISGTYYLGIGNKVNTSQATALPTGSFVKIPANTSHYGWAKEETILQISGVGPWGMIYPAKHPTKKTL